MLSSKDWIKFLGTAGARFVMIKQLRFSGGIWLHLKGKNIILDPGPGSLLRCAKSKPPLDATKLDAIILTHKHLDHSCDVNVMIEAMTEGGFKKRGVLFCPKDCLDTDPVVLNYLRPHLEKIEILEENKSFRLKDLEFFCPFRNIHPVETYGIVFKLNNIKISFVSDTAFCPEIIEKYKAEVMVLNVVFFKKRPEFQHLSCEDAEEIIKRAKPKLTILTHFGMTMLRNSPEKIARTLSQATNLKVISAWDGMSIDLENIENI